MSSIGPADNDTIVDHFGRIKMLVIAKLGDVHWTMVYRRNPHLSLAAFTASTPRL